MDQGGIYGHPSHLTELSIVNRKVLRNGQSFPTFVYLPGSNFMTTQMAPVKIRGSQNRTTTRRMNVGRGLLGRNENYSGGREI